MSEITITKEVLEELGGKLSPDDLSFLEERVRQRGSDGIRKKVSAQIPDADKILEDLSEKYFFEQMVEISPKLTVRFRTLTSQSNDKALKFALEETKNINDYQLFIRAHLRRRLAYGFTAKNGEKLSVELPDTSYFEIMMSGEDIESILDQIADSNYKRLSVMPSILVERITNFFGVWESLVYEKMEQEDLLQLAKK